MNPLLVHLVVKLLLPLLLLGGSLWVMIGSALLPAAWYPLTLQALPVATMVSALLLSLRFNRSRYSFLVLFIAIAGLSQTAWRGQLLPAAENLLFALLAVNALAFSLLRDRDLFSIHGLLRCAWLVLQGVSVWALARYTDLLPQVLLGHDGFRLPDAFAIYVQLPDGLLLFVLLICLCHAVLSVLRNSSLQAAFFGCQLGILGITSGFPDPVLVPTLVSYCGLLVTIAIVMDSHDMAYRDELTGLPSRRALNQRLMSLGRRYTIAMLDIDHFKKFNDTHGHDTGDEVLRMVASRIARVGGGGRAFRYGGEEFAVVFAGRSERHAAEALEQLRTDIETYRMQLRAGDRKTGKKGRKRASTARAAERALSVTVSIGFAGRDARRRSPEAVIKAADQALYRAKRDGRNRVSA